MGLFDFCHATGAVNYLRMTGAGVKSAEWVLAGWCLVGTVAGAQGGRGLPLGPDGGLQRVVATGGGFSPGSAQVLSETYLGMLASPDCAAMRVELALYQEGVGQAIGSAKPAAYHMRETCIYLTGPGQTLDTNGTWREVIDRKKWEAVLVLENGRTPGGEYFARVLDSNSATLLKLDAQMQELPDIVPHSLGRVSGGRQGHMVLLSDADNGRTVEMKPGEVFFLRLTRKPDSGYVWTSNRPDSMVLLESGGEVQPWPLVSGQTPGVTPAAVSAVAPVVAAKSGRATRNGGGNVTRQPLGYPQEPKDGEYQVWQLIAPQDGQQDLRFEYRRSSTTLGWPLQVFKLSVVVR
jgi:predicted secreted protein